jgi:hypothetical protein
MAAALVPVAAALGGGLLGIGAAKLMAPKAQKAADVIAPPAPVTFNDAVDRRMRDDERRRRRGAAANIITGAAGAESMSSGAKVLLGQ